MKKEKDTRAHMHIHTQDKIFEVAFNNEMQDLGSPLLVQVSHCYKFQNT